MDFFKFTANTASDLTYGLFFRGYDSVTWVERYRQPGEFEIVAPLSSGLRDILPLGTIISHTDTLEAAFVESHFIKEGKNEDPQISITGRTLDAYLENRIVGMELASGTPTVPYSDYELAAATTAQQAKVLINEHVVVANLSNVGNSLDDNIQAEAIAGSGTAVARLIKREPLNSAVSELLAIGDLGIRVVRRNNFGVLGVSDKTWFYIHAGQDKSSSVIFSWDQGEIESAEYLSTLKNLKNAALVQGRYVEEVVYGPETGYDRRIMLVDADDIDGSLDTVPVEPEITAIRAKLQTRGEEALAAQTSIDIVSIDIASANQFVYRQDYDIGDIVSVSGNYDATVKRRVIEHVEIEDANGSKSYPTLAALEE